MYINVLQLDAVGFGINCRGLELCTFVPLDFLLKDSRCHTGSFIAAHSWVFFAPLEVI